MRHHCVHRAIPVCAALIAAASASATPHFILFTDAERDIVGLSSWSPMAGFTTIHSFANPGPDTNPGKMRRVGSWLWVTDGQADASVPGRLHRLFLAGFGTILGAEVIATGTPENGLDNPSDLAYDVVRNRVLVLDNPGVPLSPGPVDNVLAISTGGGPLSNLYTEPPDRPGTVQFQDPVAIGAASSNQYYVLCRNGGLTGQGGPQEGNASVLWKMTLDAAGDVSAMTPMLDFSNALLPDLVSGAVGLAVVPGVGGQSNLFITDSVTNGIYRISVDAAGDIADVGLVRDGFNGLGEIIYDTTRRQLVFAEEGARLINEMAFDGSNLRVAVRDVVARGLFAIPSPGVMPVGVLAGLLTLRRKRG